MKNNDKSIMEPSHYVRYVLGERISRLKDHSTVLFCFDTNIYGKLKKKFPGSIFSGLTGELYLMNDNIALAGEFGIGCPATIAFLEELAACGMKRFVAIGSAGALHDGVTAGEVILCTGAFSDEGTSMHYPGYKIFSKPSRIMNARLAGWFQRIDLPFIRGKSWTMDALYRETNQKREHFLNLGADVVEMEASAIFNVAHFRKAEVACVFVVGDSISNGTWKPVFRSKEIEGKSLLVARKIIQLFSEDAS